MRRFKMYGSGVLLLVALLLVAVPASASAKALLTFEEEGVPAPSGATAYTVLNIDQPFGCAARAEGKVVANPSAKVAVTATTLGAEGYERCGEEPKAFESGHVEETTFESSGKVKVKASIQLTFAAGPCVYLFKKLPAEEALTFPGRSGFKGTTTGKLNKGLSSKVEGACEKKLTTGFIINVLDVEEEPFETSV